MTLCDKCGKNNETRDMIYNYDTGVYECAACYGKRK